MGCFDRGSANSEGVANVNHLNGLAYRHGAEDTVLGFTAEISAAQKKICA
jgi:hypothetical protein